MLSQHSLEPPKRRQLMAGLRRSSFSPSGVADALLTAQLHQATTDESLAAAAAVPSVATEALIQRSFSKGLQSKAPVEVRVISSVHDRLRRTPTLTPYMTFARGDTQITNKPEKETRFTHEALPVRIPAPSVKKAAPQSMVRARLRASRSSAFLSSIPSLKNLRVQTASKQTVAELPLVQETKPHIVIQPAEDLELKTVILRTDVDYSPLSIQSIIQIQAWWRGTLTRILITAALIARRVRYGGPSITEISPSPADASWEPSSYIMEHKFSRPSGRSSHAVSHWPSQLVQHLAAFLEVLESSSAKHYCTRDTEISHHASLYNYPRSSRPLTLSFTGPICRLCTAKTPQRLASEEASHFFAPIIKESPAFSFPLEKRVLQRLELSRRKQREMLSAHLWCPPSMTNNCYTLSKYDF